jgi:hypothetical protein
VLLGFLLNRIRKAHFPWDTNLLALLGLPLFSYLLLRSKLLYKRGKVSWKGRTYASDSARLCRFLKRENHGLPDA